MRPGTAAAVAACALAGCASGDGLLIEVVPGDDLDLSTVGAIDVWVGEPDANMLGRFIRLPRAEDRQPVVDWPFEILVVPDAEPRRVWAGAFGYADASRLSDPPTAVGTIAVPVDVVAGELRHAELVLHPYFAPDADCLFAPAGADLPAQVIVPPGADPGMLDCDDDGDPADCDDLDPLVNHMAAEVCDLLDNNCNLICDEGFDGDGDRYSRCAYDLCGPPECLDAADPPSGLFGSCDCDDTDLDAHPGGVADAAACDGVDNDCDGSTGTPTGPEVPGNHFDDDCNGTCDVDADGDLISAEVEGDPLAPGTWATTCDAIKPDCNDDEPEIYPNALELCDVMDTDCDENTFAGDGPCFAIGATGCAIGTRQCTELAGGGWAPCVPGTIRVADEICAQVTPFDGAPGLERAVYEATLDDARDTCTLDVWRPFNPGMGSRVNSLCATRPKTRVHGPFAFAADCSSQIVGGSRTGGYTLELQARTNPGLPGDVVTTCDVDLVVVAVDGEGVPDVRLPSVWVLILQQKGSSGSGPEESVLIPVEIRPRYADAANAYACPAGRSFDCD